MKKIIMFGMIFLLLSSLALALTFGSRTINVIKTEMMELGYAVTVEGYEGYDLIFDESKVTDKNIVEKVSERLDTIDSIKYYEQNGCSSTQWCHDNGWLNDTVCYNNRCHDADKLYQLEENNENKKTELDSVLIR